MLNVSVFIPFRRDNPDTLYAPGGRRASLVALLFVMACPLALAVTPYEEWAEEFGIDVNVSYDGTRVMESQGNRFEATERRAPGKMRTEVNMGQMQSGVILREDLNKAWLLMPSMGMYKEETLEGGMMQSSNGLEFQSIEKQGSESVNGHPSTKYRTRFEDNDGKGAGFVWVTDTGVPIKMDMIYSSRGMKGERITMELTELNLRPQDPEYFELPEGLQPMNMGNLGAIMQMGQQQQGQQAQQPQASQEDMTEDEQLAAAQQACLQRAAKQAAEEREKQEKKRSFSRILRSVSRTASRYGVDGAYEVSRDVYNANSTAEDVSVIADELGITEQQVEDCRNPN